MGLDFSHDGAGAHRNARVEHPCWGPIMVFALTKAAVLVEGRGSAEQLSAVLTLDLSTAVSMHTLVATEVGELGVGFVAHFA